MTLRSSLRLTPAALLAFFLLRPGWAAEGARAPASLQSEFVYEAVVEISAAVDVGSTAEGHRRYIPITGGAFSGDKLKGVVLGGGADWQIERRDGVTELHALYSMKCDDGTVIIVQNHGVISEGGSYLRTTPSFVVPDGPHSWLRRYQFVGTVAGGPRPNTVTIRVYRVL